MFIAFALPISGVKNIFIWLALSLLGNIFVIYAHIRRTPVVSWLMVTFFFIIFSAIIMLCNQLSGVSQAVYYPCVIYSIASLIFALSLPRHQLKLDKNAVQTSNHHALVNGEAILLEGHVHLDFRKNIIVQYSNNIGLDGLVHITPRSFNELFIEINSGETACLRRNKPHVWWPRASGSSYHMQMKEGELKLIRKAWRDGEIILPNNDRILSCNWIGLNKRIALNTAEGGKLVFYSYDESMLCYYQGTLNIELTMALMALSAFFWHINTEKGE